VAPNPYRFCLEKREPSIGPHNPFWLAISDPKNLCHFQLSGERSSATRSSPQPSWTVSCTTQSCSTSKARLGACVSTTPSRPLPPKSNPAKEGGAANLSPGGTELRSALVSLIAKRDFH
jgi:hypothetical protein